MSRVLFNDEPSALRSDFSGSLDAMSRLGDHSQAARVWNSRSRQPITQ
jgi:hypothetical protein